jgi:hypothetical protein
MDDLAMRRAARLKDSAFDRLIAVDRPIAAGTGPPRAA